MSGNRGTLRTVAEHLVGAVAPLELAFRDVDQFRMLMWRLGWDAQGLPPSYTDAADRVLQAVQAVAALTDNADVETTIAAIQKVGDVYSAINTLAAAPPGVDAAEFLPEIGRRLFEYLLVDYLRERIPGLLMGLEAIGIVEYQDVAATATRPGFTRTVFNWEALPDRLSDPLSIPADVYGWGSNDLDFGKVAEIFAELFVALGLPASIDSVDPEISRAYQAEASGTPAAPIELGVHVPLFDVPIGGNYYDVGFSIFELPAEGSTPPGLIVQPLVPDGLAQSIDLSGGWRFVVRAGIDLSETFGIVLRPDELAIRYPFAPGTQLPNAGFGIALEYKGNSSALLFGDPGGVRLELAGAALSADLDVRDGGVEFRLGVAPDGLTLVLATGNVDRFLRTVLGGEDVRIAFPLKLGWSNRTGLDFLAGVGFEVSLHPHLDFGFLRFDKIDLSVGLSVAAAQPAAVDLRATTALSGSLGPFSYAVDRLGIELAAEFRDGNAGPFNLNFRFLPPTGLGLSVEAGPISGGGFINFDEPNGRYSGLLHLSMSEIGIDAVGLLDTNLPGGVPPFALLLALRAKLFPPVQIGFGIALSSVGGLLALNRCINVDDLRVRFSTGTVGRFLSPEDPVRDAPILLADLAAVFPPADGIVVVGPTVQLSWVELVRLDLGVFVELPNLKVVLLGSARATIDNPAGGAPMLQLRLDVIGLLDFARRVLEFDAVLIDSQLLEVFELTGGAAFRLSWGAEPYVVMSVGGFHPAWSPAPLVFPASLTRIAAVRGAPEDVLYLRFEGYFAITTNTFQLGASIEVIVNAGPLNARGFLGYDALIRFQPFYFQIDFNASVKVRWKSFTLAGVELSGTLSGPGPVTFYGRACFEILFFDCCWSDTFTFGSSAEPVVIPVPSAVIELAKELEDVVNLRTEGGDDPFVVLAPDPSGLPLPILRPSGQLIWTQHRAPLDLLLTRFEGAPLVQAETVSAMGPHIIGTAVDWFAPGGYADLTDAEALNQKAFLRLNGGARFGTAGVADGRSEDREVEVDQIRLPVSSPTPFDFILPFWLLRAADMRVGAEPPAAVAAAIEVHDETWVVRAGDGSVLAQGISEAQAHRIATFGSRRGAAVAATDVIPAFSF